ncbi:MAG: AAA family ATPase [Candidatus Poseidoniaceae archaeon]
MEDDFLSRQDSEENSFSSLVGTVDEMTEDLAGRSPLILEGFIDVQSLITALDALRMDIQKHITQNEGVQDLNQLVSTLDLDSLNDRLHEVHRKIASQHLDEFASLTNEFEKSNALKMMKAIEITCNSITKSINQRTLTLENGEISDEQLKRIGWLDEKTRDQIYDVVGMLSKIVDFFPGSTADGKWRNELKVIENEYNGPSSLYGGFSESEFYQPMGKLDHLDDVWIDDASDLPTAKTLLESIFVLALDHIYGHLRAMFFFQSKSKPVDLETLLSPLPEIETRKQFAEMLVDKAGILTTIPFEISEEESLELNDLLSKLISVQKTFLHVLENLEFGSGHYKPVLSDVNSHMIVYKESPRTAYDTSPMWPMKRKDRYDSMKELDLFNWLGREYHSEDLIYEEQHRIVYRDFLDFIQNIGYEHKRVTAYDENNRSVRVQPKLTSFSWKGKKNKYRENASIYFYCEECPYTNREMRISFDSRKGPFGGESLTVNVGLDLFRGDVDTDEVPAEEEILHLREFAENFCSNLFKDFEVYQREHGLLKNSKFNAFFQELELKGRTFQDLILADEKKKLLDDNIFAILRNSETLLQRGVETNRGIMLAGPPGVGKSLTIDAIIADGNCTILFADFIMLHKAMDMIFQVARKYAPTILIMEDIDALGITGQRGTRGDGAGLSSLLNHMDGIKSNNGVITVATSNHPESLDWALIARPGRFDVRIDYAYPDHDVLKGIFELKLKPYPHQKGIDLDKIVAKMPVGFTGSHIQDIVNQANYISINESKTPNSDIEINQRALEVAFERALYNFNKFLLERPHIKLDPGTDASEILNSDRNSRDENSFFV